ncbi:hypothetical protein F4561_002187 [Lipingzhangella halophila]|uniref:Uncharacterized protein n=1 Tax=Lipingzhangella halophila TaxID=1783352 RepID=A0A7W7RG66_9ACTN|nr:hypothetical protein [Lipingzhangella halophila]
MPHNTQGGRVVTIISDTIGVFMVFPRNVHGLG